MRSSDASSAEMVRFAEGLADVSRRLLGGATAEMTRAEVKADNSFVTGVDRVIETRLRELIQETYPRHGVMGEEHGSHDLDADVVWVLDPLDGTAPFIAGIPVYGTLLSVSRFGRPWIGVLDYPVTGDRWVGISGSVARRNGVEVRTRPCSSLSGALMTCSSPDFFQREEFAAFAKVRSAVQYTLYGGSSLAFGMLASGRTDLAVDGGLKPYDAFAPSAVISGAGGVVTDWSGAEITLPATKQASSGPSTPRGIFFHLRAVTARK